MNVTNISVMTWCQILELVLACLRNKDWVAVEGTIEQMELTKEKGMNILDFLSEGLPKNNLSKFVVFAHSWHS